MMDDSITSPARLPSAQSTKIPSMSRSKPSSRKGTGAVVAVEDHIEVASSDDEQEEVAQEEDAEIVEIPPVKKVPKPKPTGPPAAASSSKQPAAPPPRKSVAPKPANKSSSDDAPNGHKPPAQTTRQSPSKEERRLQRLVEQLQSEVDAQEEQINKANLMAKKFEDAYEDLARSHNPTSDPASQARIKELEEQLTLKDTQIKELRNIHEKAQYFISDNGILHFTTTEAALQERAAVDQKLSRARKHIKELDDKNKAAAADKDAELQRLKDELTFTKQERDAEVERAKHLVSKPAASHSIAGPGVGNANAETIALYEDITNILVTNARLETSPYLKLTDKMFTCLCSNKEGKALNFYLRIYHEPLQELTEEERRNITSKDQVFQQCKYIPMELEKEPDRAFIERLDFLANPFTFAKDQIDVFAKTMLEKLQSQNEESMIEESVMDPSMMGGSDAGDDDSSVMEIER